MHKNLIIHLDHIYTIWDETSKGSHMSRVGKEVAIKKKVVQKSQVFFYEHAFYCNKLAFCSVRTCAPSAKKPQKALSTCGRLHILTIWDETSKGSHMSRVGKEVAIKKKVVQKSQVFFYEHAFYCNKLAFCSVRTCAPSAKKPQKALSTCGHLHLSCIFIAFKIHQPFQIPS